jgi:hypothetical protein
MTKQEILGAAIALTLVPCIVGVWGITIVIDHWRNK